MKTKRLFILTAIICMASLFSVDLAYAYHPVSPYAFTGGNPVSRIDPDGQDWYSTTDKEGSVSYHYTEDYRSQRDLKKAGIEGTYIGMTGKTNDGSQYLSLFGSQVNTMTAGGQKNLAAEMVANIDNAIINSYEADYYNNQANRDPFNSEAYSGGTNMGISMAVTPSMVSRGVNVFHFGYAGGKVRYEVNNDMQGQSLDWQDGKVGPVGGYFMTIGTGANVIIQRGDRNRSVNWIFPNTQSWQNVRNRANKLLNNRQW
ncbi:hypothetical protein [uncultured Alistipes sp.]|jgi:hypothetical protein|uniref:hypothetical protein n=1 Tax=uncultured Alistipes sp. TaxID=538949 RepID=UPI0025EEA13F|nr:hypothetical protein [uncultured Alistipes sp.]